MASTLGFLYNTVPGRFVLKLLTAPGISVLCGRFMDSPVSKLLIPYFIKKNGIDLSLYIKEDYHSFNDCFSRHIRPELRPFDLTEGRLSSPCDGRLSAYHIKSGSVIPVKQSLYTIEALLESAELAAEFEDGVCLVFRLCVDNYHRYAYAAGGIKGENIHIPGKLHTVRPVALRAIPVFIENTREYTVIETEDMGKIVQMEVGAMLVGRISNYHGKGRVTKGQEKGTFLYGGSTVILLLKKDAVRVKEEYFRSTDEDRETPVIMGQNLSEE